MADNDYNSGAPSSHVVRSGDTLSGIAAKYGLKYADLLAANPQLKNPNRIFPGNVVQLGAPPPPPPPPPPPKPQPPSDDYNRIPGISWEDYNKAMASGQPIPKAAFVYNQPPPPPPPPQPYQPRSGEAWGPGYAKPYPPGPSQMAYPSFWGDFLKGALPTALMALGPEVGPMGRALSEAPEAVAQAASRLGLQSSHAVPAMQELTERVAPRMSADADPYGIAFRATRTEPEFGAGAGMTPDDARAILRHNGYSDEYIDRLGPQAVDAARDELAMGKPAPGYRDPTFGEPTTSSLISARYGPEGARGERLFPSVDVRSSQSMGDVMGQGPLGGTSGGAGTEGVGVPLRQMSPWERLTNARRSPGVYGRAQRTLDPAFEAPAFTEVDYGKAASDLGYSSVEEATNAIRGMGPGEVKALKGRIPLASWRNAAAAIGSRMAPEDIARLPMSVRDALFGSRGSNARQLADDISTMHNWGTNEGSASLPMPNLLGTSALGPASVVGAGAGGYAYGNPMPAYQGGTDYVPQTGPAMLHQGEMVLSREQAEALRAMQDRPDWQLQMQTPFSSRAKGLSAADFPHFPQDAQGRMQVPEGWDAPSGFSGSVVTPSGIQMNYPGYMSELSDYARQQRGPEMAQEIRRAMSPTYEQQARENLGGPNSPGGYIGISPNKYTLESAGPGQDVPKTSQGYPRPIGYDEGTYQFILQNYGPRPAAAYQMHHYDSYYRLRGGR